jgi:urease accessory protein
MTIFMQSTRCLRHERTVSATRGALAFLALFAATPALAHIDEDTVERYGPFFAGVAHPVLGFDHFLAMFAVGFVSAILGGRHFWIVPTCFVAVMPIGWALGRMHVPFPPVEFGIAMSVLALGAGSLFVARLPVWSIYAAVGTFALFHGYAHGRETPATDLTQYAAGFMLGTAGLHMLGLFIGDILHKPGGRSYGQLAVSVFVTTAGLYFLSATLVGGWTA